MVHHYPIMDERKEKIAQEMGSVRLGTLGLFDIAHIEALKQSPGFGFRPIIWHLAHIGVFEAYWLLQKLRGEPPPDERYERVFDPIQTPREDSRDLPSRREMEAFLTRVRDRTLRALEEVDLNSPDRLVSGGYIFQLVLEHERQHQETIAYLLQMLPPEAKTRPAQGALRTRTTDDATSKDPSAEVSKHRDSEFVTVPEGEFEMGAVWESFAYDNESPPHRVVVPSFKLARYPTTNEEFVEFVEEGGYRRHEFWSDEGWEHREREGWTAPLYWRNADRGWLERRMFDEVMLKPDHPVTGVSWYEAQAYARFRGKRLPTEVEWEKAASWDGARKRRFAWGDSAPTNEVCNFGFDRWGTSPVGSLPAGVSHYGCHDITGNVWEWTSAPFEGFPGFEPYPYPEYSAVWYDGDHRILKGGSWATSAAVLRTSFRNFFRRHFRIAFAGIRLAE